MWIELCTVVLVAAAVRSYMKSRSDAGGLKDENGEAVKPFSAIPGPRGLPLIGCIVEWYIKGFVGHSQWWLESRAKEYGPIVMDHIFGETIVIITSVDMIEELARKDAKYPMLIQAETWIDYRKRHGQNMGLLTSSGEKWKNLRTPWNHTMLKSTKVYAGIDGLNDICTDLIQVIQQKRDETNILKILDRELFRWSLESVCFFLYDKRLGGITGENKEAEIFIEAVKDMFVCVEELFSMPVLVARYLKPKVFWKHDECWNIITHHAKVMVDAKIVEVANDLDEGVESTGFVSSVIGSHQLTPSEISASVSEIMAAAVDTTSNTVQFILYELSRDQVLQQKVYDEILEVTGGDHPTSDHLRKMEYLKATVREIQRLYPVVVVATRVIQEDTVIGGYYIPAKTTVLADAYYNGHSPGNFDDPLKIKPERWMKQEGGENINSFSSVIFGFGSRGCIGRKTAETEIYVLVARILQRFKLQYGSDTPIELCTKGVMVPATPVLVRFIDRD